MALVVSSRPFFMNRDRDRANNWKCGSRARSGGGVGHRVIVGTETKKMKQTGVMVTYVCACLKTFGTVTRVKKESLVFLNIG